MKKCSFEKPCPVHLVVQPLKNKFLSELEEHTIVAFADKVKKGEAHLFV